MNKAYYDGRKAGYFGGTWFDCQYNGRERDQWLSGFDAGKNQKARGEAWED